jgi:hypothetical protein
MHIGILPIASLLALGVVALAVWAVICVINEKRGQGRVPAAMPRELPHPYRCTPDRARLACQAAVRLKDDSP